MARNRLLSNNEKISRPPGNPPDGRVALFAQLVKDDGCLAVEAYFLSLPEVFRPFSFDDPAVGKGRFAYENSQAGTGATCCPKGMSPGAENTDGKHDITFTFTLNTDDLESSVRKWPDVQWPVLPVHYFVHDDAHRSILHVPRFFRNDGFEVAFHHFWEIVGVTPHHDRAIFFLLNGEDYAEAPPLEELFRMFQCFYRLRVAHERFSRVPSPVDMHGNFGINPVPRRRLEQEKFVMGALWHPSGVLFVELRVDPVFFRALRMMDFCPEIVCADGGPHLESDPCNLRHGRFLRLFKPNATIYAR